MGADLCLWVASWPKKGFKPNWKAGEARIAALTEDEMDGEGLDKDRLTSDLKEFRDTFEGGGREAAALEFGHLKVLITGGMSWGDTPTELGQSMQNLGLFDILDACGFNQDDFTDYKEKLLKITRKAELAPLLIPLGDPVISELAEKALRTTARKNKRKRG